MAIPIAEALNWITLIVQKIKEARDAGLDVIEVNDLGNQYNEIDDQIQARLPGSESG